MADAYDFLIDGFRDAINALPIEVVEGIDPEQARELGARAVRAALAPILWDRTAGDSFDTAEVQQLLEISRQAVNKRLRAGTLIGIPRRGTTIFPKWQFDVPLRRPYPWVRDLTTPFLEEMGSLDHALILSWANTPQIEDLDGVSPIQWIREGRDAQALSDAARRTASRLAS